MVKVPYDWGANNLSFPSAGFGTYKTTILLPKHRKLELFIPHVFSAYRLFFNGHLIHDQGDLQESKDFYTPFRTQKFSFKRLQSDTLKITIQVANFDHNNCRSILSS